MINLYTDKDIELNPYQWISSRIAKTVIEIGENELTQNSDKQLETPITYQAWSTCSRITDLESSPNKWTEIEIGKNEWWTKDKQQVVLSIHQMDIGS